MVVNFDYNRVIDSIGWWNSIYNNEFIANLVTFNCDFINFDWTVVNWWINGSRRGECGLCYDVGTTIINISTNINRVQSINKSWTTRDRRRLCSTVQLFVTGFVNGTSIFIYLWRVTVCVLVCVLLMWIFPIHLRLYGQVECRNLSRYRQPRSHWLFVSCSLWRHRAGLLLFRWFFASWFRDFVRKLPLLAPAIDTIYAIDSRQCVNCGHFFYLTDQ